MLLFEFLLFLLTGTISACPSVEDHAGNHTLLRRWYSITAGDEEIWPNGDIWWCYTPPNPVETYDPHKQTDVEYVKEAMETAFKKWNPDGDINVKQTYCGICPCEQFNNAVKVIFELPGYAWRSWMGYNVHGLPHGGNMRITWEGASKEVREPYWQRMFVSPTLWSLSSSESQQAHELGHVFGFMHEHQRHELWYPWENRQFYLNCFNFRGFKETFLECVPNDNGSHHWVGAVIPEHVRQILWHYTPFKYPPGARYEYQHLCEAGYDGYRYAMYAGSPSLSYLPWPASNYQTRKKEMISGGNEEGYRLDWKSIMMYGSDEKGSIGAFRWIDGGLIPQNQVPSEGDIDRLRQLYGVENQGTDSGNEGDDEGDDEIDGGHGLSAEDVGGMELDGEIVW